MGKGWRLLAGLQEVRKQNECQVVTTYEQFWQYVGLKEKNGKDLFACKTLMGI